MPVITRYVGIDVDLERAAAHATKLLERPEHGQAHFGHSPDLPHVSIRTKHAIAIVLAFPGGYDALCSFGGNRGNYLQNSAEAVLILSFRSTEE